MKLLKLYKTTLLKNNDVNKNFLYDLLEELSLNEDKLLRNIHNNYYNQTKFKVDKDLDEFQKDIKSLELIENYWIQ